MGFDRLVVLQELVADPVEPLVIDVEDVLSEQLRQRRGRNPTHQTVLAGWFDQAADDVGGRRHDLPLAETKLPKTLRNTEALPCRLHGKQRP